MDQHNDDMTIGFNIQRNNSLEEFASLFLDNQVCQQNLWWHMWSN